MQIVMFFKAQKYLVEYEAYGRKFSIISDLPEDVMNEAIKVIDSHLTDHHADLTDRAYDYSKV